MLYDFVVSNVEQILSSSEGRLDITPRLIKEAHNIGLRGIAPSAGQYRTTAAVVYGSNHVSPAPEEIQPLVEDFCEYLNSKWNSVPAPHLAAHALGASSGYTLLRTEMGAWLERYRI